MLFAIIAPSGRAARDGTEENSDNVALTAVFEEFRDAAENGFGRGVSELAREKDGILVSVNG